MTRQRELILRIVRQEPRHLTAQQIFLEAQAQLPGIAMGTVYNNLNAMVSEGLITRVRIPGEADRFDRAPIERTHNHLICEVCGTIYDMPEINLRQILSDHCGMEVRSVELTARCICNRCTAQQSPTLPNSGPKPV